MGLLDFMKKKSAAPKPAPASRTVPEDSEMEIYAGMRVEVTTFSGELLFVAKLMSIRGYTAELHQYSQAEQIKEGDEEEESIRVQIRGYHDHLRKAVYMEGNISPWPKHVWYVENLVVVKVTNDRAFFRLSTNIDATATTFGGINAGEKPCRLLNISVGGACIGSEFAYHEGDKFLLKVKLMEERDISAMFCQVLRIIDRGDQKYEYGCRFLELNENDQEKITQNIFAVQRKMRGKG